MAAEVSQSTSSVQEESITEEMQMRKEKVSSCLYICIWSKNSFKAVLWPHDVDLTEGFD